MNPTSGSVSNFDVDQPPHPAAQDHRHRPQRLHRARLAAVAGAVAHRELAPARHDSERGRPARTELLQLHQQAAVAGERNRRAVLREREVRRQVGLECDPRLLAAVEQEVLVQTARARVAVLQLAALAVGVVAVTDLDPVGALALGHRAGDLAEARPVLRSCSRPTRCCPASAGSSRESSHAFSASPVQRMSALFTGPGGGGGGGGRPGGGGGPGGGPGGGVVVPPVVDQLHRVEQQVAVTGQRKRRADR